MSRPTDASDRIARVVLLLATAAGFALTWLVYSRLGSGSPCEYMSDCTEWSYPPTYAWIQRAWLVASFAAAVGTWFAWRSGRPAHDIAALGAATQAIFVSVAITPMAWGPGEFGLFQFFADHYLWSRMGLYGMDSLAAVAGVSAAVLGWQGLRRRSPHSSSTEVGRARLEALLWWPIGAAVPLIVIVSAILDETGFRKGLAEGVGATSSALVLGIVLAGQVMAARRRALGWATVATTAMAACVLAAVTVTVLHPHAEDWSRLGPDLAVVIGSLFAPLIPGWLTSRSRRSMMAGQELEKTAGPPS